MNNLDIAGILQTYALKCAKCYDTKKLKELVKELKMELDLRRIKMEDN